MKKKTPVKLIYILIFLLTIQKTNSQNTLTVPTQFRNISSAITAAQPGDTINVLARTMDYIGPLNTDLELKKALTIRGVRINDTTGTATINLGGCNSINNNRFLTIDGSNFSHNDKVIIEGFDIVDGCANQNTGIGGAIKIKNFFRIFGAVEINDCRFQSNLAKLGGAIGLDSIECGFFSVNNCLFESNRAINVGGSSFSGEGGAIYFSNKYFPSSIMCEIKLELNKNVFKLNRSDKHGGALYAKNDSTFRNINTRFNVLYNLFEDNSAVISGQEIFTSLINRVSLVGNVITEQRFNSNHSPMINIEDWGNNLFGPEVYLDGNTIFKANPNPAPHANQPLIFVETDSVDNNIPNPNTPIVYFSNNTIKDVISNRPTLAISPTNQYVSQNERRVTMLKCNMDTLGFSLLQNNAVTTLFNNINRPDQFVSTMFNDFRSTTSSPNVTLAGPNIKGIMDKDCHLRDIVFDIGAFELLGKVYVRETDRDRDILLKNTILHLQGLTTTPLTRIYCIFSPFLLPTPISSSNFRGTLKIDPNQSFIVVPLGRTDQDGKSIPFSFLIPNGIDNTTMHFQQFQVDNNGNIQMGEVVSYRIVN